MKAIRLGALDYIPKPFTPDEVRTIINRAVDGEMVEASSSRQEREIIDLDVPFDREEVARHVGSEYAGMLGPSDMPVVEVPRQEPLLNFCPVGDMVCDIYAKLGNTCKAGLKSKDCPQKKAQKKKAAARKGFDRETLIGIDQPFNYEDVVSVTGPEYVRYLEYDGVSYVPYEELKANWSGPAATGERTTKSDAARAPAKILVIDDEAAVNNNIRRILIKKGYRVDQAMTRSDALKKIAEGDYGLVLLDLKIPEVRGLELLRAVRDTNPAAKVIIVTGYASIETAVETARLGAVGYLPKPFTPDEIRQATETALLLAA
jgi:DNA-binding response OmpR family regulator